MKVDGAACILAAMAILLLPLNWILAGLVAAVFHEICHLLAVWAMDGRVWEFRLSSGGAVMEASSMSAGRNLLCVLAGPVGGLLLASFFRWMPRVAICAAIQSAFNLLPVYPLDGGRAIGYMVELLPGKYRTVGKRIQMAISLGTTSVIILLALVLRLPALILPFLPGLKEKFLAKKRKKGYNIVTLK